MAKLSSPVMLMILDGFGIGDSNDKGNAIARADLKNIPFLASHYPHTSLDASGEAVGLPDGQIGNSEVGHLNIGSGRIVYQSLTKITKDIREGRFFENPVLVKAMGEAKKHTGVLHLMGLVSPGGVHSSSTHIYALLKMAKQRGVPHVCIHAFLDGRDVPPQSAVSYLEELEQQIKQIGIGTIATVAGRYYAMDRDKRWERVEKAYTAIADGIGLKADSAVAAVQKSYERGENDEFVLPTVITGDTVNEGDSVIFFNFRPDRARELTRAFTDPKFAGFTRSKGCYALHFTTMTQYENDLPVAIAYEPNLLANTLGETLSKGGYKQLHIAETEKYAHVTFFFNGGREEPYEGETRILVPSPKVATYDLQPEMSAPEVTEKVIEAINKDEYDMIILNFANSDMVGHTGIFAAAKKAVEVVDDCVGRIVTAMKKHNGLVLITADHGNAERMVDTVTGEPYTAHTTNRVPFILVSDTHKNEKLHAGILADIAPTMLTLAGISIPAEMTGTCLLDHSKR